MFENRITNENKRAVVLASLAGAYLWIGKPDEAIPLLKKQVEVRHQSKYKSHEEKASFILAYAYYLSGKLELSTKTCLDILNNRSEQSLNDPLPQNLLSWINHLTTSNTNYSTVYNKFESFINNLPEDWANGDSIFNFEKEIRKELKKCSEELFKRNWVKIFEHLNDIESRIIKSGSLLLQADISILKAELYETINNYPKAQTYIDNTINLARKCSPNEEFYYMKAIKKAQDIQEKIRSFTLISNNENIYWKITEIPPNIFHFSHPEYGDIWIGNENKDFDFYYGGTRLISCDVSDDEALSMLSRLIHYESSWKNAIINNLIEEGCFDEIKSSLPPEFIGKKFGGARCIVRPKDQAIGKAIQELDKDCVLAIFDPILKHLREQNGKIKLTPDFGRFAKIAGFLHTTTKTPDVLGINCEDGGCGGKSSYTLVGILTGLHKLNITELSKSGNKITLIGAAGALGTGVTQKLLEWGIEDIGVCDLKYNEDSCLKPPDGCSKLPATQNIITDSCLSRKGILITMATGDELSHSNDKLLENVAIFILAQNQALPPGDKGKMLVQKLQEKGCIVWPGQILTLGGALTARIEWGYRCAYPGRPFDSNIKELTNKCVQLAVSYSMDKIGKRAKDKSLTLYEAMIDWIEGNKKVNHQPIKSWVASPIVKQLSD
jgi:tetratricopeptide (TPR) repeat protein